MQRYCTELTERLLKSLDKEYNVVDMGIVVEVISTLEKTTITKEVLELTRLGKYINELRRKTHNEVLAKRAKVLLRKWREQVLPSVNSTPSQPTHADTAPTVLNGAKPQSPASSNLVPHSSALKGLIKPQSPFIKVTSPSLSIYSDQSRSPIVSPTKHPVNHKINTIISQKIDVKCISQNHVLEAVPRTHSSNKRLRKEDIEVEEISKNAVEAVPIKRQRLNGESANSIGMINNFNLQEKVPNPTITVATVTCTEKKSESIEPIVPENSTEAEVVVVKKRGRKKGSKSVKKNINLEDRVKEKLASISRNPKLKTTQELLADLQARGSTNIIVNPSQSRKVSSSPNNIQDSCKQNSITHNNKCIPEANNKNKSVLDSPYESDGIIFDEEDTLDSIIPESNKSNNINRSSPTDLTVEQILAKLPPLDLNAISWSEEEEEHVDNKNIYDKSQDVSEVLSKLHDEYVEGLNGNFSDFGQKTSSDSERKDSEFREWHEVLARPSFDGQILHILPYVIID